jgi:integrase
LDDGITGTSRTRESMLQTPLDGTAARARFASLWRDAHPKAIQERLGHSTITMTLDRYGHLPPASATP